MTDEQEDPTGGAARFDTPGGEIRHTPRSAAVLLARALGHLDLIQPETAREPVRLMLTSGIEMCAISRSLWGKPIGHVLALAHALVGAAAERRVGDAGG